MSHRAAPVAIFVAAWAMAALLAAALPLFADEAYYLTWAARLGPGYLDHPPGVAFWAALGQGHPRLVGLTLGVAAWWLLADGARRAGVARARWLPAVVLLTPLGLASVLLVTPDAPLVAAWSGVLWGVLARRPLAVAVALAACLWAKSTVVFALPGLAWVLARQYGPRTAAGWLVLAASLYAPHCVWSLHNEGLPWTFQGARAFSGFALPELVAGQLAVVTPGWVALAVSAWRRPGDEVGRWLVALSLPTGLAWLAVGCLTRVEANWPALVWPAVFVLILRDASSARLRAAAWIGGALTGLAGVAALALDRALPEGAGPPRDGPRLHACLSDHSGEHRLVAARYQEHALLHVAGASSLHLRAAGHRPSQYDRWPTDPLPHCDFVYLADLRALGGRCAGRAVQVRWCGRAAVSCQCAELGAHPSNQGLGDGAPTPPIRGPQGDR